MSDYKNLKRAYLLRRVKQLEYFKNVDSSALFYLSLLFDRQVVTKREGV